MSLTPTALSPALFSRSRCAIVVLLAAIFSSAAVAQPAPTLEAVAVAATAPAVAELAGRKVVTASDVPIGTVRDLLIDESGHVRFALISLSQDTAGSEQSRVVPYGLLQQRQEGDDLTATVTRKSIEASPPLQNDRATGVRVTLSPAEHEQIYAAFASPSTSFDENGQTVSTTLMRATALRGREVRLLDGLIGKIDSVVVRQRDQHAVALIEPLDRVFRHQERFQVPVRQLVVPTDPTARIRATATPADVVVTGREARSAVGEPAADSMAASELRPTGAASDQQTPTAHPDLVSSAQLIRQVLDADPNLATEPVRVVPGDSSVVVTGTVSTKARKAALEHKVAATARGVNLDFLLEVAEK